MSLAGSPERTGGQGEDAGYPHARGCRGQTADDGPAPDGQSHSEATATGHVSIPDRPALPTAHIAENHTEDHTSGDDEKSPLLPRKRRRSLLYRRFSIPIGTPSVVTDSSSSQGAGPSPGDVTGMASARRMSLMRPPIRVPVYLMVMFFAIASWIDINGLWVEMPLLVNRLPEGWSLPSYLTVVIQVANLGPILYVVCCRWQFRKRRRKSRCDAGGGGEAMTSSSWITKEWPIVYLIIGIGAVACILLALFWSRTSVVGGRDHSVALVALTSFLALVDCTSSVVFLPYMARFKTTYMTAFYIGEGLSGMLPGVVGLIQGTGTGTRCVNTTIYVINETTGANHSEHRVVPVYPPPNFSVEGFFYFLFSMVCVSGLAFTFLHFLPYCKQEIVRRACARRPSLLDKDNAANSSHLAPNSHNGGAAVAKHRHYGDACDVNSDPGTPLTLDQSQVNDPPVVERQGSTDPRTLTKGRLAFLLVVTGWTSALTNGVVPPTQTYACLPYGDLAYTLAVRLATVANPLACFVALFLPTSSLVAVGALTAAGTGLVSYHVVLAALSPSPPLKGLVLGQALVILVQVLLVGILSYVKVTAASILNEHGGQRALLWCGGVTQLGSCLGAVVTFCMVNVLQLFQSELPCSN